MSLGSRSASLTVKNRLNGANGAGPVVPLNISDKPSSKNNHANADWAMTGSLKPLKPKACAFYLDKAELILELLRKQTPNNVLNVGIFQSEKRRNQQLLRSCVI